MKTKKPITLLLILMAMIMPQLAWAQTAPPQAEDGYYELSTAEHLRWFAEFVNTHDESTNTYPNISANARLMNDIDAQCSAENQWIPIGKTKEYNGTFDGAGKTITNLYIDSNDENNGFIARLTFGGVLKDLTIKNGTIKSTSDYTAAFVGYAQGTISGCKNYVAITGCNYVGGIAGKSDGSYTTPSIIINCENHASVTSLAESGTSYSYVGGITGYMKYGRITLCANTGDISSTGNIVGGLIGEFELGKEISYSYNTGNVSSTSAYYYTVVGGIVGVLSQGNSTIINSVYNTGKAAAISSNMGAFVGQTSGYFNLSNCIVLKENKQVFIGSTYDGNPTLTNCDIMPAEMFANGEVTWLLNNGSDADPVWYQAIGRDALPTFEQNQYTVVHKDASGYYNEKELLSDPVTLADGTEYEASLSRIAADMTYTHSFDNSGAWYSYYVPFEMPVEELTAQGVKVAYINAIHQYDMDDDGTVDRTDLEVIYAKSGILRANFPYLVKTDAAKDVTISLSNVTLRPSESNTTKLATALADYYITGTYTGITAQKAAASGYFAVGMDTEGKSALVTPSNNIPAQRWYLSIKEKDSPVLSGASASAAKAFRIVVLGDEGEATSIQSATEAEGYKLQAKGTFNLAGQKVDSNYRGIVIINGKKILVK